MQRPKDDPPIAATPIGEAHRHARSCAAAAEMLNTLAIVSRNELDSLCEQMRELGLAASTMADWETFHTVPVLLEIVIEQAATVAAAAEAIEQIELSAAKAA